MLVVGVLMLLALWGALARIGWDVPIGGGEIAGYHGVLMVLGVLGTLIALERAVASGAGWGFLAPTASAVGALWLIAGSPVRVSQALFLTAGLVLGAVLVRIWRLQPALHSAMLVAAGVLWVGAVLVWMRRGSVAPAVPWLAAFLVLTIAAERLELSRLRRLDGRARALFLLSVGLVVGGVIVSLGTFTLGVRLAGGGFLALAAWLGVYDVARRTIRQPDLTRFIAAALLAGYAWLAIAGLLWIRYADVAAGGGRDAMLHALFLGFVISMVFAHAPIVLPAIVGVDVVWRSAFVSHLVLLHASLALRVVADLFAWPDVVRWASLLNVLAIVLFLANTALAVRRRGPVGA
jgi:hypothetical protein